MSKLLPYSANRVDLDQWRYYYNQLLFVDTPLSADFICDERSSAYPKSVAPDVETLTEKSSDDLDAQKAENLQKTKDTGPSTSIDLVDDAQIDEAFVDDGCCMALDLTVPIANDEQVFLHMAVPNIHSKVFLNSCDTHRNFIGCTTVVNLFPIAMT